ncbi:hypothetical protein [Sodalis sp. RH22]|uniref:hypothetical protein n=1 Tax=unclassified Sodalis (in: enterobacteria) TaxID=2636512 RepID=UPI0039B448D3
MASVLRHPGEELHRLRRELHISNIRCITLEHQKTVLQDRLNLLDVHASAIPPIKIIPRVRRWMTEFSLPWEMFWCEEHRRWFSELDNSFPYFLEYSVCVKCKEASNAKSA